MNPDPIRFDVLAMPGSRDFAACRQLFEQTAQQVGCVCKVGRVDFNGRTLPGLLLTSIVNLPRMAIDAELTFGMQLGVRRDLPSGSGRYAISYLTVPPRGFPSVAIFEQHYSFGFLQAQGARVLGDDWTRGGIPFAFERYCASEAVWTDFKGLIATQPFCTLGPSFIEDQQ